MRTLRALVLTAGFGAVLATGCAKKPKEKAGPDTHAAASAEANAAKVALKFSPDDAQQKAIEGLLGKLNRETLRFPSKDTNVPENARLFTYLAATSNDKDVVAAALSAMYGAYSSHSKRKAQPDADFVAVVKHHLGSEDPNIAVRAFLAARTAISGKDGSPEIIAEVVKLADRYPSGAGRYTIIDTLRVVSAQNRNEQLMKIFTESLDAKETYVVSYALQALYRSTRSIEEKSALKAKAFELAKHADPGVRGRAIELLGALGKDDPEVLKLVLGALGDESAYVRSEASESIARLRHRPAIHELVKLLDDKENNRYDIRDWRTLDGKPGRLHHDGSPWSHVYDAAMNAIRSLSAGELKLERINPKEIDKGLDANAAATRSWYAKVKHDIPKESVPLPEKAAGQDGQQPTEPKKAKVILPKPAPKPSAP